VRGAIVKRRKFFSNAVALPSEKLLAIRCLFQRSPALPFSLLRPVLRVGVQKMRYHYRLNSIASKLSTLNLQLAT